MATPTPPAQASEPERPFEPLQTPDAPMPEPGFPMSIWDAMAPPPSRDREPTVTRVADDVDTGEVPLFDMLEAPSDAW